MPLFSFNIVGNVDTDVRLGDVDSASLNVSPRLIEEPRIRFLVIHSTAGYFKPSYDILTGVSTRKVSAHYLIGCDSTGNNFDAKAFQLVDERLTAWHAGGDYINKTSVGIELVDNAEDTLDYLTSGAYASLLYLVNDICNRYAIPKKIFDFLGAQDAPFTNSDEVIRGKINLSKPERRLWISQEAKANRNFKGIFFHRDIREDRTDPVAFDADKFIQDVNLFDMDYYLFLLNTIKGNSPAGQPQAPSGNWNLIPVAKVDSMEASVAKVYLSEKLRKERLKVGDIANAISAGFPKSKSTTKTIINPTKADQDADV